MMYVLTYDLMLLEPFLATGLEGDPNTKTSLSYIPGSSIRGVLIERYIVNNQLSDLNPSDADQRRRFLSDETLFLNAYPLLDGKRSLPTPLSWVKAKADEIEEGVTFSDFAVQRKKVEQPKGISNPFCRKDGQQVRLLNPSRRVTVHTRRNMRMGRATAGDGAVFQYNALESYQAFSGVIICSTQDDLRCMMDLLDVAKLRIGGARSAGYGSASVLSVMPIEDWHEAGSGIEEIAPGKEIHISCLSPCIIRDSLGNYTANLSSALEQELGTALNLVPEKTHRRLTTVGGFNRKWGLPICQAQAITEGSVFTFICSQDEDVDILKEKLNNLELLGMGERRNDGFGRIAINWQTEETLTYSNRPFIGSALGDSAQNQSLTGPVIQSGALANRMAERMLRSTLERSLAERVRGLQIESVTGEDGISNSQLSRLRVEIREAINTAMRPSSAIEAENTKTQAGNNQEKDGRGEGVRQVEAFLKGLKQTSLRQYERVRIDTGVSRKERLLPWVQNQLSTPSNLWADKNISDRDRQHLLSRPKPVQLGQNEYEVPDKWREEYMLRLIDAVLAQATKNNSGTTE